MPIKRRKMLGAPPSKTRLSKQFIDNLRPRGRDYLVSDTEVPRMKLKVTPAGARSFILRYRNENGQERKFKLGDYPDLNVARARKLASERLLDIAAGKDPAHERADRRSGVSLSELFARFIAEYGELHLRPTTVRGYQQLHARYIASSIGKRSLVSLSRDDILNLQRGMVRTPYSANRTLALIKRLFNWAHERGLVNEDHNPAGRIKPYRERTVERLLSEDEHRKLAESIQAVRASHPGADSSLNAIIFLFFTGCRKGEATKMRWSDVDFERKRIEFIGAKSGDRTQPMSSDLAAWLEGLRSRNLSDFLFPGRYNDRPISELKRTWELVRHGAGLPDLRLHDIRHNVLSDIAAETDLATAKAVGGHKSIQSTMRYVHSRASVTQAALERSGERMSRRFLKREKT